METRYPEGYPLWVLRKVAATPCRNAQHHTSVEFRDAAIVPGCNLVILCADCCTETHRAWEEKAERLLTKIAADPDIKPGELPWRLSEEEWSVFKHEPERFRKKAGGSVKSEAGGIDDLEAWLEKDVYDSRGRCVWSANGWKRTKKKLEENK